MKARRFRFLPAARSSKSARPSGKTGDSGRGGISLCRCVYSVPHSFARASFRNYGSIVGVAAGVAVAIWSFVLSCSSVMRSSIGLSVWRDSVAWFAPSPTLPSSLRQAESEQVMQIAAAARKHEVILLKFIYLNLRTQILVI